MPQMQRPPQFRQPLPPDIRAQAPGGMRPMGIVGPNIQVCTNYIKSFLNTLITSQSYF